MNLFGFGISLFMIFVSSLLGVKWLDNYSSQYVVCAEKVWLQAKDARRFDYLKPHVMKLTENMDALRVGGKACPALRADHVERIQVYLTKE